jgi:hypothetical protein
MARALVTGVVSAGIWPLTVQIAWLLDATSGGRFRNARK